MRRLILVIGVAAILVVAGWYWWDMSARPVVQVTSFSVSPSTIPSTQNATLTIGLRNNDNNKGHSVRLVFTSDPHVSFYSGNDPLKRSGSDWEQPIDLAPTYEVTLGLRVKAGLDPMVLEVKYPIHMKVYVDAALSESKSTEFLVKAS